VDLQILWVLSVLLSAKLCDCGNVCVAIDKCKAGSCGGNEYIFVMPVSEPDGSRVRSPLLEPDATVWGQDTNWILQFDNVIKHPGGKYKGCRCDIHDRTRSLDSGTKCNSLCNASQ
jgi:hypothetical protein